MAKKQVFIHDDFLLTGKSARRLYHEYAENLPIIDYHSHLPIAQIREDVNFQSLTQVWLYGDHYKWRALRTMGFPEPLISGWPEPAPDRDRFLAWAQTLPRLIGNPLYHWTHLELKRYFGVDELLSPATADRIYTVCNQKLAEPGFSVRSLMEKSRVECACTTDDPADSLEHHLKLAETGWKVGVFPAWRPDKALAAQEAGSLNPWLDRLGKAAGERIRSYDDQLAALRKRHDFFHRAGCRVSDYGLERPYAIPYKRSQIKTAFKKLRDGKSLEGEELERYRSSLLYDLLVMDAESDWTQQLHLGAKRRNNLAGFQALGPDTGFDSIGDFPLGDALVALLNRLDGEGKLGRTIIYDLNPRDDDLIASIIGSFQRDFRAGATGGGPIPGKIQFGTAWWHNDHRDGMLKQMGALANLGLLSVFVGMLTDSRSFLSYPRHEYFRRILCQRLGTGMDEGEIPDDFELTGEMVKNICYENAKRYFQFPAQPPG
ncbi:MAG: glucuronate isomerase [Planctomycetota bacterium]|jgi:glucuronate isomerase|nr:glucuronate isomerase [Planctomycetota bacterium]